MLFVAATSLASATLQWTRMVRQNTDLCCYVVITISNALLIFVGDTIYSGAHGSQNFSKTEPMAIDTAGFIASMTKLMTSVATMQIIEKGLVGLDDDLGAIVPELGNREILVSFDEATKTPTFEKPTNPITLRFVKLQMYQPPS